MTSILLLGAGGQVGAELRDTLACIGRVRAPGRELVDLADVDALIGAVRTTTPAIIVNAAAYNAVDKAEEEPDVAMQVNGVAPGILAEEAKRAGALLVHYSTDYVFDGAQGGPYREDDLPRPVNRYGLSKLAGERAIQAVGCAHLILRTSWIYSGTRPNFVLTILRLARMRPELRVVDDQTGSPTWSRALAEATAKLLEDPRAAGSGVYHLCAGGSATRYRLACAAIARARELSGAQSGWARVTPVKSADYPLPARRPARTVLSNEKIGALCGVTMDNWEVELERFLATTDVVPTLLSPPSQPETPAARTQRKPAGS